MNEQNTETVSKQLSKEELDAAITKYNVPRIAPIFSPDQRDALSYLPKDRRIDAQARAAANGMPYNQLCLNEDDRRAIRIHKSIAENDFHLTDLGNAERLVAWYGDKIRYCDELKRYFVWDGTRWAGDRTKEIEDLAVDTCRTILIEAATEKCGTKKEDEKRRKSLAEHAIRTESAHKLRAMVDLAKSNRAIALTPDAFDRDPWLFNIQNGTLDLRSGKLNPHNPENLITKISPVTFTPEDLPFESQHRDKWEAFLFEVFLGDIELIEFVQRFLGYSLTGDTSEQKFAIFHGSGSNGKSTLLRVLAHIFGDYFTNTPADTLMIKRDASGIPNDVARLNGARLVEAQESERGRRLAESKIKALTGGDPITARFLHAEFFTFHPEFKLILVTNHKPQIEGVDYAIWRRIRLVPFGFTVPDEDQNKDLVAELIEEAPGIFAWLIDGCRKWQRDGLTLPERVEKATNEYRTDEDILGEFLAVACDQDVDSSISETTADLYAAYGIWCTRNAIDAVSTTKFGIEIKEHGVQQGRSSNGRYWKQIKLRDDNG